MVGYNDPDYTPEEQQYVDDLHEFVDLTRTVGPVRASQITYGTENVTTNPYAEFQQQVKANQDQFMRDMRGLNVDIIPRKTTKEPDISQNRAKRVIKRAIRKSDKSGKGAFIRNIN